MTLNFAYLLRNNAWTESSVQTELGSCIMDMWDWTTVIKVEGSDMKDETVTCILTYCVRLIYVNGFIMVQWLFLVTMNIPTSNCNEGMDCMCRQLTTCVLTPSEK